MKGTLAALLLTALGLSGCAATVTVPKLAPDRPVEIDTGSPAPRYTQEGRPVGGGELTAQLKREPAAASHVRRSEALTITGAVFGLVGGALVGAGVGLALKPGSDKTAVWGLVGAGAGAALGVSLPCMILSVWSYDQAVKAHNSVVGVPVR